MKKCSLWTSIIVFLVFLSGCQAPKEKEAKILSSQPQVRLIIKEDSKTIDKKIPFKKGATAMDVLKQAVVVEEKNGFITSIDGYQQDTSKKRYWFFKVNDKLAPKAADQIKLKDKDVITFYQEKIQ